MTLSFIKPISTCEELLLITYNDMIIGSITFNTGVITDININTFYLGSIKHILLNKLLYELGVDYIELLIDKGVLSYYEELGFKKMYNTPDDQVLLSYKVLSSENSCVTLC